jgi:hypothetical protein
MNIQHLIDRWKTKEGKTTTLEGRAKTEDAAAAILAAWHDTLAAMALQSIPDPNAKGQDDE